MTEPLPHWPTDWLAGKQVIHKLITSVTVHLWIIRNQITCQIFNQPHLSHLVDFKLSVERWSESWTANQSGNLLTWKSVNQQCFVINRISSWSPFFILPWRITMSVLWAFRNNYLKCGFYRQSIGFLGCVISPSPMPHNTNTKYWEISIYRKGFGSIIPEFENPKTFRALGQQIRLIWKLIKDFIKGWQT
jgi:hypothetical protein